jgi:uncharacterized membrane protein HdeD (DUF308 family)
MNLTEAIVGAAPLVIGALLIYFAFAFKSEGAPRHFWRKFAEDNRRLNLMVVGVIAIVIGILLILNGFRII